MASEEHEKEERRFFKWQIRFGVISTIGVLIGVYFLAMDHHKPQKNDTVKVNQTIADGVADSVAAQKKMDQKAMIGNNGETQNTEKQPGQLLQPTITKPQNRPIRSKGFTLDSCVVCKTEKAFFYDAPRFQAQTKYRPYMIAGDTAKVIGFYGDFIHIKYTNGKTHFMKWVRKFDFENM